MNDIILVLNAGSSSIKFRAYDAGREALPMVLRGSIDGISATPVFRAMDALGEEVGSRRWQRDDAIGHTLLLPSRTQGTDVLSSPLLPVYHSGAAGPVW